MNAKLEDSLPQSFRTLWRCCGVSAHLLALCIALSAPMVAQTTAPPATQDVQMPPAPSASTPEETPVPAAVSGESAGHVQLAQAQGKADTALVDWVLANSGQLKGDLRAGEFRVAFSISPAEGWWDKAGGGKLTWHDAPAHNVHLRIFVLDMTDGRLVPGLTVHAKFVDANGNEQALPVDFGWYPLVNAYGGNVPLGADSSYTLHVTIDPMDARHVMDVGERFAHTTVAEFPPVQIAYDSVAQLPLGTAIAFANEVALLKPCNAALRDVITSVWRESVAGSELPFADYFVGYALDLNGLAMPITSTELKIRNKLTFNGKDVVRVVVLPRDSRTGRLIPGLKPEASLIAADGKLYGPGELPLTWHQWFNHYGRNARVPRKAVYKLRVHFEAPGFRRWGSQSERFAVPADVEFEDVSLKPGKLEKKD